MSSPSKLTDVPSAVLELSLPLPVGDETIGDCLGDEQPGCHLPESCLGVRSRSAAFLEFNKTRTFKLRLDPQVLKLSGYCCADYTHTQWPPSLFALDSDDDINLSSDDSDFRAIGGESNILFATSCLSTLGISCQMPDSFVLSSSPGQTTPALEESVPQRLAICGGRRSPYSLAVPLRGMLELCGRAVVVLVAE